MRTSLVLTLSFLAAAPFAACAVEVDDVEVDDAELIAPPVPAIELDVDPNRYAVGHLDGQDGWVSNGCMVFPSDGQGQYIKCTGGKTARRSSLFAPGGHWLDVRMKVNANVTDATHGKWALEGPQGRVLQILAGCGNLRVAFQMSGPTATLVSFPCNGSIPSWYRVQCFWQTGGTSLVCGAAPPGQDPSWVSIPLPAPMRPHDAVTLNTFALPGATLFGRQMIMRL
jgi:hypothetical protein